MTLNYFRRPRRWILAALVTLSMLLASPLSSTALELVDDDEVTLDLTGIANGTYGAEIVDGGDDSVGPFVSLARLKLDGGFVNVGSIKLQVEGASGALRLLDAVARLDLGTPFYARFGRFRPSVSANLLISAPNVYTSSRALLTAFAPDRLAGAELGMDLALDRLSILTQIALFQPARASFDTPRGQLLMARLLLGFPVGVDVHFGYAQHVFTDNERPGPPGGRVVPNDLPLDAAFILSRDGLYAHLEGLVVVDAPDDEDIYGLHVLGAYRFGPPDGIEFEPTAAYDFTDNGSSTHRMTVGGNTYFMGTGFELETHYELTFADDRTIHGLFASLQIVL